MKKYLLLFLLGLILPALAFDVYNKDNYIYNDKGEDSLLFVIDFSNSMGEYLEHKTKSSQVKETIAKLAPQISGNTKVGLRVYGHNCNLLAFNACRSSELIVPLGENNNYLVSNKISKLRPRGMTPITYSLKQAISKDFEGIKGSKHIILLTDGGENCDESPCDFAIDLVKKRRDIKIDVIAYSVENSDDLAQLQCTADVTGGKFIEANTNARLFNSMEELLIPHKEVEALIYNKN